MEPEDGRLCTHALAFLRRRMVHARNCWLKLLLIKAKAEHLAWYRTGLGFVKGK
jgi:hypothetical protein